MMCEMCGKDTNDIVKAKIEGAEMDVCSKCSKHGQIIRKITIGQPKKIKRQVVREEKEIIEEVVEDFAQIIKKSREKTGMSQEDFAKKINEKESLLHKIEVGSLVPSLKLARKLERTLHLRLIEVVEEHHNIVKGEKKNNELTLGDVIKIKKK